MACTSKVKLDYINPTMCGVDLVAFEVVKSHLFKKKKLKYSEIVNNLLKTHLSLTQGGCTALVPVQALFPGSRSCEEKDANNETIT